MFAMAVISESGFQSDVLFPGLLRGDADSFQIGLHLTQQSLLASANQIGFGTLRGSFYRERSLRRCNARTQGRLVSKVVRAPRLRPEAFAGRVHNPRERNAMYPIHQ
jgi:hypothetical protein